MHGILYYKGSDVVAATLKRLSANDETKRSDSIFKNVDISPLEVTLLNNDYMDGSSNKTQNNNNAWDVLKRQGVVRLGNILSEELCIECLDEINSSLYKTEDGICKNKFAKTTFDEIGATED